jgi:hypothetical protein
VYIQIVQGRRPFHISLAKMPFNLTVSMTTKPSCGSTALHARVVEMFSFSLTTVALLWLGNVVNNTGKLCRRSSV